MVERSSISSSERSRPGNGRPIAVYVCLAIVCLVEIILHWVPERVLHGYGEGLASYYDVRHSIEDYGSADVIALGTSRGRESLLLPALGRAIKDSTGQTLRVASYACAGSRADEMLQVMRLVRQSPNRPRLALYFITPAMLLGERPNLQRLEMLGSYSHMYRGRIGQILPAIIDARIWNLRCWMDRHYKTFRYRHRLRHAVMTLSRGRSPLSAVQGQETIWQRYNAGRSLLTHPISQQRVREYARQLLDDDGQYVVATSQLLALSETLTLCRESGIPVIMIEAAISRPLGDAFSPQLKQAFRDSVESVLREYDMPLYTMSDIGVSLTDGDFREQSHLNRRGAAKVTEAVNRSFAHLLRESRDDKMTHAGAVAD